MNYTIASLEDVHGDITIDFNKSGNQYVVGVYSKVTKAYKHNKYESQAEAMKVFSKLTEAILTGCYSYEDRVNML